MSAQYSWRAVIATVAICLATWVFGQCAVAGEAGAEPVELEGLFRQALISTGAEYVAARDVIVQQGALAEPLLKRKTDDPDWHVSLLAEAILGRIADPEQYRHYEELMLPTVYPRMSPPWPRGDDQLYSLATYTDLVFGEPVPRAGPSPLSRRSLLEKQAAPFLYEVIAKAGVMRPPEISDHVPPGAPGTSYTVQEVVGILNVSAKTVQCWFDQGEATSRAGGSGAETKVGHLDLERFVAEHLPPGWAAEAAPEYAVRAQCLACGFLARLGHPVAVPLMSEILHSPTSLPLRSCAAAALGLTKSVSAVEPLVRALSEDESITVRETAVRALGLIGDPRSVSPLARALRHRALRPRATWALAAIKSPDATRVLVDALSDEDPDVRLSAVRALRSARDHAALEPLLRSLQDPSRDVRAQVPFALEGLNDRRWISALAEVFQKDTDEEVRENAALVLGRSGDGWAVGPLVKTLKTAAEPTRLRRVAAHSLAQLRHPVGIEALVEALMDTNGSVRAAARYDLLQLANQDLGDDPAKWREWWEQNKSRFQPSEPPAPQPDQPPAPGG